MPTWVGSDPSAQALGSPHAYEEAGRGGVSDHVRREAVSDLKSPCSISRFTGSIPVSFVAAFAASVGSWNAATRPNWGGSC